MSNIFLIFVGAGFGGVLRYWIANGINFYMARQFPYGTLLVNISGCLLMGILYIILTNRIDNSGSYLKGLLLVGFLGGYTTFSSFSIETVTLLENGYWLNALANVLLSTTLCIFSSWAGMVAGKQFVSIEKQVPALVEYENQGE